ncbi:hypothetical protein GCM10020366_08600 [Saccharopolyspora gregorii]|uniref:ABC transporter domain-containing protein n=1 Tax=Saccharopolyspora gregorii TaxID=33914 RepID=A0ABP6RLP1_9PSEU
MAALRAGLGLEVPGMSVDRQCASGLSAIVAAAALVRGGAGERYLAGGVESASTAPWRAHRPRSAGEPPRFYSRAPFAPAEVGDPDMGPAADLVAAEAGVSRRRQDEFAARSHERAVAAQDAGRFDAELVDVSGLRDERPRRGFTPERLARFRPAFTADGTATAANSCGISDGAAAVLVTSERERRRLGVPGLRLVAERTCGVDPNRLGLGAVPALRHVLRDRPTPELVEFTEAFAGQVLACTDAAGIDERAVSPDGGAIALGHPWGASGAVLVVRLFSRMVREDGPRTGWRPCPPVAGWAWRRCGSAWSDRVRGRRARLRRARGAGRRGPPAAGEAGRVRGGERVRQVHPRPHDQRAGVADARAGAGGRVGSGAGGRAVRRRVGFVFTNPDSQIVMPTAGEDVAFSLRRHGVPKAERERRAAEVLARHGLDGYAEHPAHQLSGGQKQLLALCSMLVLEPDVLVCDEPTTLLDLRNKRHFVELLQQLPQQVVLVTHDLHLLDGFDRVVVIDEGRVAADDAPAAALAHYRELAG